MCITQVQLELNSSELLDARIFLSSINTKYPRIYVLIYVYIKSELKRKRIREKDLFEKDKERKTNVTTTTSTTTVTSIRWRIGELRYRATTERETSRGYAKEGERGGGNRKRLTPDERRPTPR